MPLYDYQCHLCGEVFEVKQKFADPLLEIHEACGGKLERLISAPALQFKGTGWYVTDYGRNGKSGGPNGGSEKEAGKKDKDKDAGKKTEPASSNSGASDSASKSDSKPAPAKTG